IVNLILKFFKQSSSAVTILEKEDIKMLLQESEKAGNVQKRDSEIINRVINLGEQKVYAAMRPRIEIVACDINSTVDQLFEIFIESGYSKIPIYENSIDNIIGVVYHHDLFKKFDSIREIVKPINFYPETKSSIDLLKEFLEEDVKIGIIIDEYGGTAGMVTSEDLIEELLGEIRDEYDIEENICRKVSENTYLISGRSEIDNVNELLNLNIPEGNYETFSGYIVDRLGKIPNEGEEYIIDYFKILIVKATPTRIDLVKVVTQNQIEE
ncbi:MAG: hemolysin family protein, partial [Ignavibacteria bacterium]|nr:hemolysin family protein [Ignavibacteria bacterium]